MILCIIAGFARKDSIICAIAGFSNICNVCSICCCDGWAAAAQGLLASGVDNAVEDDDGGGNPQGLFIIVLGMLGGVARVAELEVLGLVLDVEVDDPHGLGMAVPVAPAKELVLPLPDDGVVFEPPGAMASIMGSCTSRYMLLRALNPPGMFSSWDMAKSCDLIMCCIACGLRIISNDWRNSCGLLKTSRSCGFESMSCCI